MKINFLFLLSLIVLSSCNNRVNSTDLNNNNSNVSSEIR